MDNLDPVHCFLDTNILIHFQMFDEVDWCEILAAKQVYLMFAPVVIGELDQHKNNTSNEWRQKRARKVVAKLKALLKDVPSGNPARVRPGVLLLEITREPRVDWPTLDLDQQVKDDRLLATMIEYREQEPSRRLLLLSDDFLLQRRAPIHGIQVMEPRESIKEVERPSIATAKIRELERELQEYKNQLADLHLGFWENGNVTNVLTRVIRRNAESGPSDEEIHQQIAERKSKLDLIIARGREKGVGEMEIERFSEKCSQHVGYFSRALLERRSWQFGPSCRIQFILLNNGSAPAMYVSVWCYFPAGSFVVGTDSSHVYDEALVPNEPEPEWAKPDRLVVISSKWAIPPVGSAPEPLVPEGPLYDFRHRGIVQYTHPKFRQKDQWVMKPVKVYLPPTVKDGFQVEYHLEADNLPDPIKGQLNIVLQESD